MAKKSRSRRRQTAEGPAEDANDGAGGETVEQVLGELESVVADLERGDLPLETALERFEQGVKLARRGNSMLDAVEQRVEMLLADEEQAVPFESEETDDE